MQFFFFFAQHIQRVSDAASSANAVVVQLRGHFTFWFECLAALLCRAPSKHYSSFLSLLRRKQKWYCIIFFINTDRRTDYNAYDTRQDYVYIYYFSILCGLYGVFYTDIHTDISSVPFCIRLIKTIDIFCKFSKI